MTFTKCSVSIVAIGSGRRNRVMKYAEIVSGIKDISKYYEIDACRYNCYED
jgi:hypothetical protein